MSEEVKFTAHQRDYIKNHVVDSQRRFCEYDKYSLRISALEMENAELREHVDFMREQFKVMQSLLLMVANDRVSTSRARSALPEGQNKAGEERNTGECPFP